MGSSEIHAPDTVIKLRMTTPNLFSRRQHLRLWFEYLRLSHRIVELQLNLEKSSDFYAPWGDIHAAKFDNWWKEHKNLFGETSVQVIDSITPHENVIHLAIPLNVPISRTLNQVEGIIRSKQLNRIRELGKDAQSQKSMSSGFGKYDPTPGVEIRGNTLYEILVILTTWIDLNRPAVNTDFCHRVLERLKSRPRSKWVPYLLLNPPQKDKNGNLRFGEDQIRQIRRYLKRGMEVCRSVSLGEFPGRSRLD